MFRRLTDDDPQVRGLSAWALGKLKHREAKGPLEKLVEDEEPVELYDGGELHRTTVGRLAQEALATLE